MTTTNARSVTVSAERHVEEVRRWRWLPWPTRLSWWATADVAGVACFVAEDSMHALTDRLIEHVRFLHEDDSLSVVVFWNTMFMGNRT